MNKQSRASRARNSMINLRLKQKYQTKILSTLTWQGITSENSNSNLD